MLVCQLWDMCLCFNKIPPGPEREQGVVEPEASKGWKAVRLVADGASEARDGSGSGRPERMGSPRA